MRSRIRAGRGAGLAGASAIAGSSVDLNFAADRYSLGVRSFSAAATALADSAWSPVWSRALPALKQAPGGFWETFGSNVLRRHADGALIEAQAVNRIRNGDGAGAVAGSPGTLPTNWAGPTSPNNGIVREIIGNAVRNGIAVTTFRFTGTASAAATLNIQPDANNYAGFAASVGQVWSSSCFVQLDAGAFPSGVRTLDIIERDAGGTFLSLGSSANVTTADFQRVRHTRTLASATVAFVIPRMTFSVANGETVDFTVSVGFGGHAQAPAVSSPIPTASGEVTRPRDVLVAQTAPIGLRPDQGFFAVRARPDNLSVGQVLATLADGAVNNQVTIRQAAAANTLVVEWTSGGVVQRTVTSTYVLTAGTDITIAAAWDAAGTWVKIHTDAAATAGALTVPAALTTLAIGSRADGTNPANGVYRRVVAGNTRPTDADMANIFTAIAA